MAKVFDVVVVGARCAGSPLAAFLARRGVRVCVVDRARFPSEIPSTHMIHPTGVALLADLGLLDGLLATGAPPLERGGFVVDDVRLGLEPAIARRFEAPWLCIRRETLDLLLIEAAQAAGAEVRTQTAVTGLVREDGVVRGVRTDSGSTLLAPLVIGADGPHSAVARLVGSREYHVTDPGRLFMWAYFEGAAVESGRAELGRSGDLGYLAMPTDAGLFMAGVAVPMAQRRSCLAAVENSFTKGTDRVEYLADALQPATRVGPVRVMARWHGYFREAAGPGWALVGDAGHFKDPTPAQGISDALRQAEALASSVEAGLGGGDLASHLAAWWRWRDEDAWDMYWFAHDMGAAGHNAGIVTDMLRGLSEEPDGPEKFLRVLNHELAPPRLFSNARGVRTLLRSAVTRPRGAPQRLSETRRLLADDTQRRRLRRHPVFVSPGASDTATNGPRDHATA
jgi:2-polyprenyl-6-methoxyphenol hydroxylase-like FAD-dependent oxidoreductase